MRLRDAVMEAGRHRYGIEFPDIVLLAARLLVDLHAHDMNECDPEVSCSAGLTTSDEYLNLVEDVDDRTRHLVE